jgi:competence protein ComEC
MSGTGCPAPRGRSQQPSPLATSQGIPDEDAEAMRNSGLAHLLSVSGLHLTAVVGAVMLLTLKILALSPALALRFRLVVFAAAAGALAGIAYTLLTGAEVPTVRACIAAILVLLGIALGRDALTLRLVATAALVVLLLWPESLPGPSFQMSFAAIVAIVVLHDAPPVRRLLERREEGLPAKLGRGLLGPRPHRPRRRAGADPDRLVPFPPGRPLRRRRQHPRHSAHHLPDHAGRGARLAARPRRPRRAFLVAGRQGLVAAPLARPHHRRRAGRRRPAAGDADRRLRARRRGRAVAVPVADALADPRRGAGGGGSAVGARHAGARHPRHRRRQPCRAQHPGRPRHPAPRAGDYVRDTLAEASGSRAEPLELEGLPNALCSADLCFADVAGSGRSWRILATRSDRFVPVAALARACAEADIAVSDRRLPAPCRPRWLKADRAFLERSGGLAVTLGAAPVVATVAAQQGHHPWAPAAQRSGDRAGTSTSPSPLRAQPGAARAPAP